MLAGTMVVLTLTTALVFALVVFPALCYCVNLHGTDVGSLSALFQGRWGDFWGRRRSGLSSGAERHGAYVKVGDDGPDMLEQIIELTGLEAIDAEARAAAPQAEGRTSPTLAETHPASVTAPRDAVKCSSRNPESLEPPGIWRSRDRMLEEGNPHTPTEESRKGREAPLHDRAAAKIFQIGSMAVRSEVGASSSNWGGHGGWNGSSRGPRPDSLHFQEWGMSGIPSTSAIRSSMVHSGFVESQPDHESFRGSEQAAPAGGTSERASGGAARTSAGGHTGEPQPQDGSGRSSGPQNLPERPRLSKGAEVGVHAIGGSTEGLVAEGGSSESANAHVDAVPTGISAIGGSVIGSGSVASKDSM